MTAKELNKKLLEAGAVLHGDRIAVAREKPMTQTKGGLFIPETAQARQHYGVVVMKGTSCAMPVEIGDGIYIPLYGGVIMRQKVGGDTYMVEVLNSKDIFLTYVAKEDADLAVGELDAQAH